MNKLALFAIALGSLAVACAPPTTINITPSGGSGGNDTDETHETEETEETGTGSTTTGAGPTAHDFYIDNVHDSLMTSCGACHTTDGQVGAPPFLDNDPEVSYAIIKQYPNLLKEPAESILITQPPHTGPALSDGQKEIVGQWLTMELDELNSGGSGSGSSSGSGMTTGSTVTLEDMLAEFAACMDLDLWEASGMDTFYQQQTNGEGPCGSCHNTGVGALWLSSDVLETFEKNRTFPYIMRLVTPVYEGSTPVDLAPSTRLLNKGKEPCQNPPICHPKYDLTTQNKEALQSFVATTLAKWQAGGCSKP